MMELRCVQFWYEGDDEPYTTHYITDKYDYDAELQEVARHLMDEIGIDEPVIDDIGIIESYAITEVDGYKINVEKE